MIFLILFVLLIQPVSVANASEINPDIADTLVCMDAAMKYEETYNIQQHLLTTIATVETGRWNETFQRKMAWPWSINVKGRSYYYKSKEEAIAAVKKFRNRGYKSIDVGCMQINMLHHAKGFDSLEDAFDPYKNVEYAARFLTQLNSRRQNWMHAATDYHSKKPSKAKKYRTRLMLAMIEVEEGHSELVKVFGPKNVEQRSKRNWFARLFGGRELSNIHMAEVVSVTRNIDKNVEIKLSLNDTEKEPEI